MDVRAIVSKTKNLQRQMNAISSISLATLVVFLSYPLYNAAFRSVDKKYRLPMLLALPVFRFLWKKWTRPKLVDVEDIIPIIMMFTIELFNALYLATCMQTSGSPTTTTAIIAFDLVMALRSTRRLHSRARNLRRIIDEAKISPEGTNADLLSLFVSHITQHKRLTSEGVLPAFRIRSNGIEYTLSAASVNLIRELENVGGKDMINPALFRKRDEPSVTDSRAVVHQTLQLLFRCEFMLLGEYFECAIPILYMVYLPVLKAMKNSFYYGHIWALSRSDLANVVLNIGVYSLLEFASLAALMVWLSKKLAFSSLHLLAFVLDEHMLYVQSNVMMQIVYALQYTIAHLGADYSFQFAWMKDPTAKWWIHT